jgi:multiple sugar transport system permease protein
VSPTIGGTPPAAVAAPPRKRRGRGVSLESTNAAGWLFVGPALALIFVFFFLPVAASLLLSLTDYDIYAVGDPSLARFVGIRNYLHLLHSPEFWQALRNTFVFALAGGPLTVGASLAAALLVNAKLTRFRGFFRTVYFIPFVTTLVAVSVVWRYLYHPQYGLIDFLLAKVGIRGPDWLGDPHWALAAIILMSAWKNFGYNMLIFIAGLQSIPDELYEAAMLDGAGPLLRFRHVTLPMLGPTMLFVAVITMIGYFQLFAEPYVMTQGGPLGSTTSMVLLMYQEGFRWWRMGYAASLAFVLFLVMLLWTALQLWLQRRTAR